MGSNREKINRAIPILVEIIIISILKLFIIFVDFNVLLPYLMFG